MRATTTSRWVWGLAALAGWLAGGALAASPHAPQAPPAHPQAPPAAPVAASSAKAAARLPKVDLNQASRAQLKQLPGIGDAEAERIVAGRPYLSKADLVTRKVLPAGVYQTIRHQVIAVQKAPSRRRAGPAAPAASAG